MVLAMMKAMSEKNKYVKIDDVFTNLRGQYDKNSFENVIKKLEDDGIIFATYDDKTYSLSWYV